jgi:hypothetical protein
VERPGFAQYGKHSTAFFLIAVKSQTNIFTENCRLVGIGKRHRRYRDSFLDLVAVTMFIFQQDFIQGPSRFVGFSVSI